MKQFAVLGLGRFGQSLVRTLSDLGYNVLACDDDADVVQDISQFATHVIQMDVTDEHAVSSLGLGNFDVVIVAIGKNIEASIIATLVAKEMGAPYVIAKASSLKHKSILEKIGADRVVLPEWEMGARIATNLVTTNIIDLINISDEFSLAELDPLPQWVDQSIQRLNVRAETGLNIIAIKRGKKVIVSPKPQETLQRDDIMVVIGDNSNIKRYSNSKPATRGGH